MINGIVCDYKYLQSVTGFNKGSGGRVDLTQDVDPDNDQLLMTFRSNDEVIFNCKLLTYWYTVPTHFFLKKYICFVLKNDPLEPKKNLFVIERKNSCLVY